MLCFFISTLFSRANIAAAAGGVIFFCFYLPYSFLVVWEESLSSDFKIISVREIVPFQEYPLRFGKFLI